MLIYVFLAFIVNDTFQDKKSICIAMKKVMKIKIIKNNEKKTRPLPLTNCENLESSQLF